LQLFAFFCKDGRGYTVGQAQYGNQARGHYNSTQGYGTNWQGKNNNNYNKKNSLFYTISTELS